MNDDSGYIELVRQAQLGDRESLNNLAELVQGRVYAYVYRIILQEDVAQDIVQESMVEMVRMLGNLRDAERFWPWLRSIALNKVHHFYKVKQRHRTISMPDLEDKISSGDDWEKSHQGLANLLGEELRQFIFKAMQHLSPRHRMVLNMRCYEKMEYSQIAELTGRTELAVRVLFYRAKKSLLKQLSRRGLHKGFLLSALVLFGKMTAPSEAAAAQLSVTATTVRAGLTAELIGLISSQSPTTVLKAAAIPLVAVGGFTVGSMVPTSWVDKTAEWTSKAATTVREKWSAAPDVVDFEQNQLQVNRSGEELWYYYPENADEAVMMRRVKYDSQGNQTDCWLQNERANYYYNKDDNTIYINNHRIFNNDLSVRRLPADDVELTGFLSTAEGKQWPSGYIFSDKDGLLVIVKDRHNQERSYSQIIHHYNVLDEEYFRYNWLADAKVIDNRDIMHQWGWTYFQISGQVDGRQVSGLGRLPFVYEAGRQYRPWLRLQVANGVKIIDGIDGACVYKAGRKAPVIYPGNSFFKGLARPWMGLHTIDIIRRDAAKEKLQFETRHTPGSDKAEVVITQKLKDKHLQVNYLIDLEKDVIDEITFSVTDSQGQIKEGQLRFYYLQEIDRVDNEYVEPKEKIKNGSEQEGPGMLWFTRLAESKFQ